MKAKQKALELVEWYENYLSNSSDILWREEAKICATKVANEMIKELSDIIWSLSIASIWR